MISRRSRYDIVDFSDDEFKDDEQKSYCTHCLEFGFQIPLRNRVYPEGQPIPPDHDQWKMCLECGLIVPIYELEKEASVKDVVEIVDNPFDQGKDFLGIDNRKSANKRKRQRDRERELDHIKDDDFKRELRRGNTLISYIEYQPQ